MWLWIWFFENQEKTTLESYENMAQFRPFKNP
jgi:hypothetical protein